ncbi:MAG: hypothetical protein ACR2JC_02825 [Chloroflexota bacterium]
MAGGRVLWLVVAFLSIAWIVGLVVARSSLWIAWLCFFGALTLATWALSRQS